MSRVVFNQLLALGVIAWIGEGVGVYLFLAGLITVSEIEYWNSVIWYFYLPVSGLLLGGCFFGMVLTSESKSGQLQLNQSQQWMRGIKFWCTQNQWVAAACLILYLYSIFHFTMRISSVFQDVQRKNSTTVTAPKN